MARPKKLKEQEVIDALRQSHGLKTGAAEILGVSFPTIERYIAESEEARGIVEHWRIRRRDRAEYKLDEAIERAESWAIMFTLKNAKDREYSDRVDVSNTDGSLQAPPLPDEERLARMKQLAVLIANEVKNA